MSTKRREYMQATKMRREDRMMDMIATMTWGQA
jgi:hypothetical protein